MGKLFGTDGIRGKANQYPLIPSLITRIGQAVATVLGNRKEDACIIVGTDTRISSGMIESSINSGICSCGINVLHAGVIPTPGVAYLTAQTDSAMGGVVISASHNPFFDNGIKIFGGDGYKLPDQTEAAFEQLILGEDSALFPQSSQVIGQIASMPDADTRFLTFLQSFGLKNGDLKGLKLVIDCANGATHRIAPVLFKTMGANVTTLFSDPDGKNINENCGSEHTTVLSRRVVAAGADMGVAFDGDGDRLAAVDENGRVLTGDQVIAILANDYKSQGQLQNNLVVSTIMSNIGLTLALGRLGIDHQTADVGDRRVMEKMRTAGAVLGGEDSGHIILLDRHTTGDGLLSAIRLMEVMVRARQSLSSLAEIMVVAPQALISVPVQSKPDLRLIEPIQRVIKEVGSALKDKGRVLVRYSGTQPLCRIMVEGETKKVTEMYCQKIAQVVSKTIG